MKVLEINNGRCYFYSKTERKVITEIEKIDLLEIIEKIYNDIDVEFDDSESCIIHNDAEKIIYNSLVNKIGEFKSNKINLQRMINDEFEELEKKYKE